MKRRSDISNDDHWCHLGPTQETSGPLDRVKIRNQMSMSYGPPANCGSIHASAHSQADLWICSTADAETDFGVQPTTLWVTANAETDFGLQAATVWATVNVETDFGLQPATLWATANTATDYGVQPTTIRKADPILSHETTDTQTNSSAICPSELCAVQ